MKISAFLRALINVSEKGANIARIIRSESSLLELLVQEKTGDQKNARFVQDFKTLADVLVQEVVRYDLKQQVNLTLSKQHILGSSKLKDFACNSFKFDENGRKFSRKHLWEKEKLLVLSNFSFSRSVFKRLILQTRKNQGMCGKGLSCMIALPCHLTLYLICQF